MIMKLATAAGAVCDLCHHHQPSLYCSSDSAFLCFHCDSQVHTANFLVARHIRLPICKSYHSDDDDDDDDDDDALSSSSSSSSSTVCISSKTNSKKRTSADWKTREVLVSWCSRLGGGSSVLEAARRAFKVWWVNRTRSEMECPYRVGLAASLWLGLTKDVHDMKKRIRLLKRLEEISGVPAKLIVLEQSKLLAKTITMKHRHHHLHQEEEEESWAEC